MSFRLYPRLPRPAQTRMWHSICSLSIQDLSRVARACHPDVIFAATGGQRVTPDELQEIRDVVLQTARDRGFPESRTIEGAASFDAEAAGVLYGNMDISPGEASRDDVWSFIGMVLLPDVARWRFPKAGEERFRGGATQRNTFQRLWWRAHTLRDPSHEEPLHLLKSLPEDALVGIMERPGVSSNRVLALKIAQAAADVADRVPAGDTEGVRREAYVRIRERMPVIALDLLEADALSCVIGAAFDAAVSSHLSQQRIS